MGLTWAKTRFGASLLEPGRQPHTNPNEPRGELEGDVPAPSAVFDSVRGGLLTSLRPVRDVPGGGML
eukprot:7254229-Heterocapsa_arctica.AAC.1